MYIYSYSTCVCSLFPFCLIFLVAITRHHDRRLEYFLSLYMAWVLDVFVVRGILYGLDELGFLLTFSFGSGRR